MEKYSKMPGSLDFPGCSAFVSESISQTKKFCSLFQEKHKRYIKNEKKLKIFEKFEGLSSLSPIDLERLEKHLSKGLDLVKEERIKRKYEKKISDLQIRLGENFKEPKKSLTRIEESPENPLMKTCEELMRFLQKFEIYRKELEHLCEFHGLFDENMVSTAKKTSGILGGAINLEDTLREEDIIEISRNNENAVTKVSSFGTEMEKKSTRDMGFFNEILNSQKLEVEINEAKNGKSIETEEHSPDFSFQSQINPYKNREIKERKKAAFNLSFDQDYKKQRICHRSAASISGVPFTESLEFSFHFDEENEGREDFEQRMLKSANDVTKVGVRENQYLKKLKRQMLEK